MASEVSHLVMSAHHDRIVTDFRAMYPEELVARYSAGERDFHGSNLLRAELERLADELEVYEPPRNGVPYGYWGRQVSPLWIDSQNRWEPLIHWDEG